MPSPAVPVLTYHGYNIAGNDYSNNDHVALAADLAWLHAHDWSIVSLDDVVGHLFDGRGPELPARPVAISFDDGTDLDWQDVEFGELGRQRGFFGILDDFRREQAVLVPVHATTFVIASPDARERLAAGALQFGHGMGERWWRAAQTSGLMSIGNHSWDHRHPLIVPEAQGGGHFFGVDHPEAAEYQVVEAGRYIAERIGCWPSLFAYPWGQASDFLRQEFFPQQTARHRCRAAFGTEPGLIHSGAERWYLPRFVCGEHWSSPDELAGLLS